MFNFATAPSVDMSPSLAALATVLRTNSVAREILRFVLKNERAMDTVKGIAAWWVCRDELAVQQSLHQLVACGAVLNHALISGVTLYGLTRDAGLCADLRRALTLSDEPRAVGDQPRGQKNLRLVLSRREAR